MKKGFTLLELLIVIAILAILAGAMMPLFKTSKKEAMLAKAKSDLDTIRTAAMQLYYDTGTPVKKNTGTDGRNTNDTYCLADNINSNCTGIQGWNGPYLTWTNDPWGHGYRICGDYAPNPEIKAHSWGPNGIDNTCTGDDICLWIHPEP